jgi:Protein of unknown function (DUF4242)
MVFSVEGGCMPEYVIEREVPGAGNLTEDEIREVSLRSLAVLKEMGSGIQWMHSYVTNEKIYCVYFAQDEEKIREHARHAGLPANRISAVRRLLNPEKFSGGEGS